MLNVKHLQLYGWRLFAVSGIMQKTTFNISIIYIYLCIALNALAVEVTVPLKAAGDITTWPGTPYRWMDIADNLYAEAYRDSFVYTLLPETLNFEQRGIGGFDNTDNPTGMMTYNPAGELFKFQFSASGLNSDSNYTLIYFPQPWPGLGLIQLGNGAPDILGNLEFADSIDTGSLPAAYDENYPNGAEIWLVFSSDVSDTMIAWNESNYLFGDTLITYLKAYTSVVTLTYSSFDTTFSGTINGTGLKPNFALQVKIAGKPSAIWGSEGDDWGNEQVGYNGRWWEVQPNPGNRNDPYYDLHKNDPAYIFQGYLLLDYFVTDENGDVSFDFALDNSLHVLWKASQRTPGVNDTDPTFHDVVTFVPPAYDVTYTPTTIGLYGEWEPGRAYPGEAELPNGTYNVQFVLTEESFHSSGLGGYWAAALTHDAIQFTINKINDHGVEIWGQIETATDVILADYVNVASLDISATDGYDTGIDIPEPSPPVSEYLSLYFPHPEWGSIFGNNFMVDVRNGNDDLINEVKVFRYDVDTDQIGETVELSFSIGSPLIGPEGVVIYDLNNSYYQNIREDNQYSFTASAGGNSFDLRLGDATAPSVNISYPQNGDTLISNNSDSITWTIDDVSPLRQQVMYYSLDAGSNWTLIDSVSGSIQSYDWFYPDTFCINAKLKVNAWDWPGNSGSDETVSTFNIGPNQMSSGFNSGWHMTSIPLNPDDNSIANVYGDDVISGYFLFEYAQITGYNLINSVNHGVGYWLALEDSSTIDIDGDAGYGNTNLPLGDGWNIIGGALPIPVPISALEFTDGFTTHTYSQAVTANWISPSIYGYSNAIGGYELTNEMESWKGYWLQTIISGLEIITTPPGPGGWDGIDSSSELDNKEDWFVLIEISQNNLFSCTAGIGVYTDATDGYDIWFDIPAPPLPPSGEYVHIVFPHQEWPVPAGNVFSRDIRAPFITNISKTWEGLIEASQQGETRIDFGDIARILPDRCRAVAELNNETIDLIFTPEITFQYSEPCRILITVLNAPLQICDLTISLEDNDVVLNWGTVTSASNYYIYRSSQSDFDIVGMIPIGISTTSEYVDEDIIDAGVYFYRVTSE